MKTDFKVGDKIRVVHEGVVESKDILLRHVALVGGGKVPLGEVTVLERASFKPGTVAVSRLAPHSPATRTATGWRGVEDDDWEYLTDGTVRGNPHFTVIHEPSAT